MANYNSQTPFYNTVKQWRTLQKHALTSGDLPNTEFSLSSSFITEALSNSLQTIFQAYHHSVRQRTEGGKHGVSSRQTVLLKDKVLPSQGTKQPFDHMQSLLMHKNKVKHASRKHLILQALQCFHRNSFYKVSWPKHSDTPKHGPQKLQIFPGDFSFLSWALFHTLVQLDVPQL